MVGISLLWRMSKARSPRIFNCSLFESRLTLTQAGLKVNRSIIFSCIKMSFTAYVLCNLRLFKLKIDGQTIQAEKLTKKLQIQNQNSR